MIVPALLTDNIVKLQSMLDLCQNFARLAQIDIMDGEFVPSSSVSLEEVKSLNCNLATEAHLMVSNPLAWIDTFKKLGSGRIIFHAEIKQDIVSVIKEIKARDLEVGIALNPGTAIVDIEPYMKDIDMVLFMSVNPGFYGAAFIPDVLAKIVEFKAKFPEKSAGIDGGIKLDNAREVRKAGTDIICVGSAILKANDPALAYQDFIKILND